MTTLVLVERVAPGPFLLAAAELGREVVRGFRGAPPGALCAGRVTNLADAADVVLAVAGGAGVVVEVDEASALGAAGPAGILAEQLADDLRRFGPVRRVLGGSGLDVEALALLDLLRAGRTVGAAAAALHLSRRSAERRLASARDWLGVATNTEAVLVTAQYLS